MADETTVLEYLKKAHPGWVKYGHFYGPKYGELFEYRVVPKEPQRRLRMPEGFSEIISKRHIQT